MLDSLLTDEDETLDVVLLKNAEDNMDKPCE